MPLNFSLASEIWASRENRCFFCYQFIHLRIDLQCFLAGDRNGTEDRA